MPASKEERESVHLLVADDDEAMATMLGERLVDLGYAVTVRTRAAEVQGLLREPRFDVLVTDLRMPEVDGLELLTESKRVAPERPVIATNSPGCTASRAPRRATVSMSPSL